MFSELSANLQELLEQIEVFKYLNKNLNKTLKRFSKNNKNDRCYGK